MHYCDGTTAVNPSEYFIATAHVTSSIPAIANRIHFISHLPYNKFAISTIGGTILYPLFLSVFEGMPEISALTDNTMLAAVFGGVLMGAGVGLILRVGGSTGGTDILALIINKYAHLNLSLLLYIVDGAILFLQISFSDSEQVLFGILILASITLVMNRVMLMGSVKVQIFAISEKCNEIREWILSEGDAGATLFSIQRGYTQKEEKGIMCIIPRRKLYMVRQKIYEIDPLAFLTISEVKEVVSASREIR